MEIHLIILAAIIITVKSNAIDSVEDNEVFSYREYEYAENHFATLFYKALAQKSPGNFLCSPMSAHIALSTLSIGARGRVLEDIRRELIDVPDGKNFEQYEINHSKLTLKGNINFFNQLFIDNDYKISPEYKRKIKIYRSGATNINFTDTELATHQINNWCQIVSNGRITDFVSEASISNKKLLVINAVYFKAMWVHKFNPDTIMLPFYVNGRSPKQVPVMYQRNLFNFGRLPHCDAEYVRLQFRTSTILETLYMYIILPTTKKGLPKLEENFHTLNFTEFNNDKSLYNMDLYIPKFRIESTLNLKQPLTEIGLGSLFNDTPDLSEISRNLPLKVDEIIQKTFLEVDEEGSEASTTSAVNTFGPTELRHLGNLMFQVNRPFLVAVTYEEFIMFVGRVMNPTAEFY